MAEEVILEDNGRVTLPRKTIAAMGWQPGIRLRLSITADGDIALEPYPAKRKPRRTR